MPDTLPARRTFCVLGDRTGVAVSAILTAETALCYDFLEKSFPVLVVAKFGREMSFVCPNLDSLCPFQAEQHLPFKSSKHRTALALFEQQK